MFARVTTVTLLGASARRVELELHVPSSGLPGFSIGGLAARSVREAEHRTRAACAASGLAWPPRRYVANLAPARLPKEGTHFDLALALAVALVHGRVAPGHLGEWMVLGELGLDGTVRGVPGVLAAAQTAAQEGLGLICPTANGPEAAIVPGLRVAAVPDLSHCLLFLRGEWSPPPPPNPGPLAGFRVDLAQVKGQSHAKRALEIAAAGKHNALLWGPPGSGKTMLARRLPTIQPRLQRPEAIEITTIHSIAGLLPDSAGLITERPFRAPHHNTTVAGLIGGGSGLARPGEAVLAHGGCLFLDELPLFPSHVLESLRAPLEDGVVRIVRSGGVVSYPSRFALIGAMNPCPCGHAGSRGCECSPLALDAYRRKLSGPLLDRIDLFVSVAAPTRAELLEPEEGEGSEVIRARVDGARAFRAERVARTVSPGDKRPPFLRAGLSPEALGLLSDALENGLLSARGLDRVTKVARTIADLAHEDSVGADALAEALSLRQATIRPGRAA